MASSNTAHAVSVVPFGVHMLPFGTSRLPCWYYVRSHLCLARTWPPRLSIRFQVLQPQHLLQAVYTHRTRKPSSPRSLSLLPSMAYLHPLLLLLLLLLLLVLPLPSTYFGLHHLRLATLHSRDAQVLSGLCLSIPQHAMATLFPHVVVGLVLHILLLLLEHHLIPSCLIRLPPPRCQRLPCVRRRSSLWSFLSAYVLLPSSMYVLSYSTELAWRGARYIRSTTQNMLQSRARCQLL